MLRLRTLGVRTLLLASLALAFLLAAFALAATANGFSARARDLDRVRDAEQVARTLLDKTARAPNVSGLALETMVESGLVRGIELSTDPRTVLSAGERRGRVVVRTEGTRRVTVWAAPAREESALLSRVLLSSFVLTAFVLLAFTYFALTAWILRPLENLTRASERIARGTDDLALPIEGVRETARLGESLTSMAARLRADKDALQARLVALEQKTKELHAAQAQLVRSERLASVGRLGAGIAHEIGNPLAAILGLIEILRDGDLSPQEQSEFLERAQRETERIQRIIRDLLDFARPGRDDDSPLSERVDVSRVAGDAVRLVEGQAKKKDLNVVLTAAPSTIARGSEDGVTQVLVNLIFNAIDASPEHALLTVAVAADDDHVIIDVDDQGPGIAEHVRETLFEPFVTTKPVGQGTGLGLAVCSSLVERMGGSIGVETLAPNGTRFRVRLQKAQ